MTLLNVNISKDIKPTIARLVDVKRQLKELESQKAQLEKIETELKEQVSEYMRDNNYKTWDDETTTITIKDSYIRKDFDKARFASEHKDLYENYLKDTSVKESMIVKLK